MGNLCWPCHKIGQGRPKVMIYIFFVELFSLMLHAKFQNHRPSSSGEEIILKVFAIYSHGGHLGHVTLTIYINFHSPFPKNAPHDIWLCLAIRFQRRSLNIMVISMYITPVWVQTCPCGPFFFRIINLLSICPFP